jgi:hypothetical protein
MTRFATGPTNGRIGTLAVTTPAGAQTLEVPGDGEWIASVLNRNANGVIGQRAENVVVPLSGGDGSPGSATLAAAVTVGAATGSPITYRVLSTNGGTFALPVDSILEIETVARPVSGVASGQVAERGRVQIRVGDITAFTHTP